MKISNIRKKLCFRLILSVVIVLNVPITLIAKEPPPNIYSPPHKITHYTLQTNKKVEYKIVSTVGLLGTAAILSNDPKKNSVWLGLMYAYGSSAGPVTMSKWDKLGLTAMGSMIIYSGLISKNNSWESNFQENLVVAGVTGALGFLFFEKESKKQDSLGTKLYPTIGSNRYGLMVAKKF